MDRRKGDGKSSFSKKTDRNSKRGSTNRKYTPVKKSPKVTSAPKKDGTRLNKFIANAGVCSRREADEYIKIGMVQVNGKTITEMGYTVKPTDIVKYDGATLKAEKKTYILLNKPKGFTSSTKDMNAKKMVSELIYKASPYQLKAIGPLGRPATGVLLLTNDEELLKKFARPTKNSKIIYHIKLNKSFEHNDLVKIKKGVMLDDKLYEFDKVEPTAGGSKNELGVECSYASDRFLQLIFSKLGYEVTYLDRVYFDGLTKKGLKRGSWRVVNELEINNFKKGALT